MDEVKMYLFVRWISTCYADIKIDNKGKSSNDLGFDNSDALSLLNVKDGYWYKEQIKYFKNIVYPNLIKNGSVDDAKNFLIQDLHENDDFYEEPWSEKINKICLNCLHCWDTGDDNKKGECNCPKSPFYKTNVEDQNICDFFEAI
jgi:hypothetical protein